MNIEVIGDNIMHSDLLLVIPAYNEEDNILSVCKELSENYPQYDYIVVNDGSDDSTKQILKENDICYLDYPVNLGLGAAFYGGLLYGKRRGYKFIMQYDADGQHDAVYIEDMLDIAQRENADVVIGSRYLGNTRKPWTLRMIGSRLIGICIRLTTNRVITDPTSGMRLYGREAVSILSEKPSLEPEPDMLVFLLKNGRSLRECSVVMKERVAGASYFSPVRIAQYMFRVLFSIIVVSHFRKRVF